MKCVSPEFNQALRLELVKLARIHKRLIMELRKMLFRKWFLFSSTSLLVLGVIGTPEASAQCSSHRPYSSNYGYQNPSFYGQAPMHPYQSSYYHSGYSSPASYFPATPVPQLYPQASYYPAPTQPVYNTYNHYSDPRHDHHPWHLGHFLMGHY